MERVPLLGTILIVKRGNRGSDNRANNIALLNCGLYIANDNLGLQKWDAICSTAK